MDGRVRPGVVKMWPSKGGKEGGMKRLCIVEGKGCGDGRKKVREKEGEIERGRDVELLSGSLESRRMIVAREAKGIGGRLTQRVPTV